MLPAFDDLAPLRIMGIDPGTDTLGVSVLDVHLHCNTITLSFSNTFKGTQLARDYRYVSQLHGDKIARLKAHEDNLTRFMMQWCPHEIISEAPYMGRFPAAYAALVECMTAIRNAVMRYDWYLKLFTADPPTVKNSVGVGGKSGDKTLMKEAIQRLFDESVILNPNGIDIDALDEHSIDSIAVAYVRARHAITTNTYRSHAPDGRLAPIGGGRAP